MIYQVDRREFIADSPEELVRKMRNSSFTPSTDEKDYMRQFAERAKKLYKIEIRHENEEQFLDDCVKHGIIKNVITH